jgi:hypothetical protein
MTPDPFGLARMFPGPEHAPLLAPMCRKNPYNFCEIRVMQPVNWQQG